MNSISIIKSKKIKYETIATPKNPFKLVNGSKLDHVDIAYETFGTFDSNKLNVILIVHALTGDSHVGTYKDEIENKGWWSKFVGPGLIFDTEKYYIICSNVIGGCMGSTGPASISSSSLYQKYGTNFPIVTIKDMVKAQKLLLDKLNIKKLLSVVGGSMGGMQVLQWAISYPYMVKSAIPIATTSRLSPLSIALNEVGRRAILNDEKWNFGDYPQNDPPKKGLALARMIAHITYLSDESMREKFGRYLIDQKKASLVFHRNLR